MPQLLEFQETSVKKLSVVVAGLLGDDMGLGKTVQAIAIDKQKRATAGALFKETYRGKPLTLVVAPLSVIDVWVDHYAIWAPHLKVKRINPKDRQSFIESFQKGECDVYVLHWEALRLTPELQTVRWFHVIADEAHRAKNRKAQQTVALKKLFTQQKLAASGTAADNRPDDLWSVLNWLYPRVFTSYWRFRNKHLKIKRHNEGYCLAEGCETPTGAESYHQRGFDEIMGVDNVDVLMEELAPFYVRRLKEDVWKDMPEKFYTRIEVDLLPVQRRAYDDMRKTMLAWVGQHEDQPIAAPMIISQLTRLQQFACAFAKIERVLKKRTTFCNCEATCSGHLVDVLKLAEPSSKLDAVMELIEDHPEEQFVVFSQSKQVVNMLARRLASKHIPVGVLTGDTPQDARPGLVRAFQDGKLRVFTGTIAAGGVGITLTAASTVIFIDRAWSPSVNRQAEDRLHRIGQLRNVNVIDIVARHTIDLGRLQRIELKWSWIKEILGDKPPQLPIADYTEMTEADMAMHDARAMVGMMGGVALVRR